LPSQQWTLLAQADGPFFWLHSMEDPDLALPVTNPWSFFPEYEVKISDDRHAQAWHRLVRARRRVLRRPGE